MRNSNRGRLLLLLLAVLMLSVAGLAASCGGDEEDEEAAPGEAETQASEGDGEAGHGEPIKIGHLSTCEGPFAPFYE